jgi:plasmid stability protein
VKNITVSVPDEVYRRARIRAAERDTSVSALVSEFLLNIADEEPAKGLRETIEAIRKANPNFSATDLVSREELHDRDALRRLEHPDLRNRQR